MSGKLAYVFSNVRHTLPTGDWILPDGFSGHEKRIVFGLRWDSGRILSMLQKNHLQPPRPVADPLLSTARVTPASLAFVSAEDFDRTGILAGVDPCESRYWWMPDLYEPQREPAAGV